MGAQAELDPSGGQDRLLLPAHEPMVLEDVELLKEECRSAHRLGILLPLTCALKRTALAFGGRSSEEREAGSTSALDGGADGCEHCVQLLEDHTCKGLHHDGARRTAHATETRDDLANGFDGAGLGRGERAPEVSTTMQVKPTAPEGAHDAAGEREDCTARGVKEGFA